VSPGRVAALPEDAVDALPGDLGASVVVPKAPVSQYGNDAQVTRSDAD
jgi:hypothetical protein